MESRTLRDMAAMHQRRVATAKSKVELRLEIDALRQRIEIARLKEMHLLDQVIALREEVVELRKQNEDTP